MKIGTWVFIKSSSRINDQKFKESFGDRGIFGRIINIKVRYNQFTGKKLPNEITVRAYFKRKRGHLTTYEKYIEPYQIS